MIDEAKVQEAVAVYTRNPYWKEEWDEAPTPLSRRVKELEYYSSWMFFGKKCEEHSEVTAEIKALREQFGLEDWKHELRFCGVNPYRSICVRKIKELEEKAQLEREQG